MSAVLVDSNILLDIMTKDPSWFSWSAKALANAAETFRLVINPVIYAEVSVRYSRIEDLNDALPATIVAREAMPYEAALLAGRLFLFTGSIAGQGDPRRQTSLSVHTRR